MKTREQLQDEYENALFALLMYDVAQLNGRCAEEENKRLQNDPTAKVPAEVDQRCLRTIYRYFFKKKLLRTAKLGGMFAVILLIGILLCLWLLGSNQLV